MISKCCICGTQVETKHEISFFDLPGAELPHYVQKIAVCSKCGFAFTQNPFTAEQLSNRYKNMSKFEYDTEEYFLDYNYKSQCKRQKNFLMENIDFNAIDSILEIGAASGYNLYTYAELCQRVYGIEPSSKNCALSKKLYNVEMFNGMFDEYMMSPRNEKYDIIFLSMVLEHIVNPNVFISECSKLCNKYIFIEVPTLDIRHKEEAMGIFCEEHVNLFTLDSLNHLMEANGFELVNAEAVFSFRSYLPAGYPAISTVWEKIKENQPNSFTDGFIQNRYSIFTTDEILNKYMEANLECLKEIESVLSCIPVDEKIGIWGIGHHVAMLMANTSLASKRIVRVYDSDQRKQGMLFNSISIQPFESLDIQNGTIDKIVITTYTAQLAILKDLKRLQICEDKVITLYKI